MVYFPLTLDPDRPEATQIGWFENEWFREKEEMGERAGLATVPQDVRYLIVHTPNI